MTDNPEYSEAGNPIYRHQPRSGKREHVIVDQEALDKLYKHINNLGAGIVFHELVSDLVHIDVHIINPETERNYYVLVTTGMSDRAMQTPDKLSHLKFAELMLCLPSNWPMSQQQFEDENNFWPIRLLKSLARLPHEYNTWLGVGHTIPNFDPPKPYAHNTRLCGAMIAPPLLLPPGFDRLKVRDDKVVNFYSVIPLYAREMEFKLKHGANALFDRLDDIGISELVNINRQDSCRNG